MGRYLGEEEARLHLEQEIKKDMQVLGVGFDATSAACCNKDLCYGCVLLKVFPSSTGHGTR